MKRTYILAHDIARANAVQNLVCQGMLASDRGQRNKPAIYTVTPDGEWLLKHRAPKVIPQSGQMPTPREAVHGYVPYTPPAWSAPRPGSMVAYELPSLENGVYRPACGPKPIMARSF